MNNVDRGPILEIGRACGEPVRRALDELLDIFERQVRREHAHELAEKVRQRAQGSWDEMKPLAYAEGREDGLQAAADLIDPEVE